jgi:hypothetical protein
MTLSISIRPKIARNRPKTERYKEAANMEPKKIRFIDTSYRTLFILEDGGEIEITLNDGSVVKEGGG